MNKAKTEFLKYFKRGEQICVRGIDWKSHGYIRKVTKEGIWLVQLRNQKEILYGWDCFEVAHHCGYWVEKISDVTARELFTVSIEAGQVEAVEDYLGDCLIKDVSPIDGMLWDFDNFKSEGHHLALLGKKCTMSVRAAMNSPNQFSSEIIINRRWKYEEIFCYSPDWDSDKDKVQLLTANQDRVSSACHQEFFGPFRWTDKRGNKVSGFSEKVIELLGNNPTQAIKNQKEKDKRDEPSIFSVGDPYMFEGKLVSASKIWEGPQGYIFASPHGELFL